MIFSSVAKRILKSSVNIIVRRIATDKPNVYNQLMKNPLQKLFYSCKIVLCMN